LIESEIAIRAQGLVKTFRMYRRPMDVALEILTRQTRHLERTVVDNIDFEMRRGEVVGVLGRNGAGKSTLLRLIAGNLEKTSGTLQVRGRITAILELGTGFHPYYTGRENIYMGGLCLGMSRAEIDSKIDAIIDYSELREVIDQPFKTYSTGMQARLTFSTSISTDPDILIIDEALSVGDARFQATCFRRIQQLRENKATILLVSHDANAITSCCDRAMILESGRIYADGSPKAMTAAYHKLLFSRARTTRDTNSSTKQISRSLQSSIPNLPVANYFRKDTSVDGSGLRYGTGEATLIDWGIFRQDGTKVDVIESGSKFCLAMTLLCHETFVDGSCGFVIKDSKGNVLWGMTNVGFGTTPVISCESGQQLVARVDGVMWLAAGNYFVTLGFAHQSDGMKIDFAEDLIEFSVVGPGNIFTTSVANLQAEMRIEQQDPKIVCQ
jgi:ABC-type polysaccharide/polyol phosphate transport system ATPase subunit